MEFTLQSAFNLFISASALPTVCCLLFSLAFWGQSWKIHLKRALAVALVYSVYTDITIHFLPTLYHLLNGIIAFVLLLLILFRHLSFRLRMLLFITTYFILLFNDVVFIGGSVLLFGRAVNFESPYFMMMFAWPPALLYLAWGFWLRKRKSDPGHKMLATLRKRKNHVLIWMLIFLSLQLIVLILEMGDIVGVEQKSNSILPYFTLTVSGVSIMCILLSVRWMSKSREEAVKMTQEHYIEDMNRLFTTVRGQRHDFLNHVTVIQGFLKMKKYDELERYAKELLGEITEVNELVRIGHPALSALMQSKLISAEASKIRFSYNFQGMEMLALGAKSVDLVKIMGNLINNAMDEVAKLEPGDRWIEVTGSVEGGDVWFTVRNPGRVIPERELPKLFQHGYSTKTDGLHSGIGLSVVKERVEHYSGEIAVESSSDRGTLFTLRMPIAGRSGGRKENPGRRESV